MWYKHLKKIYKYMVLMENNKYLEPKFSEQIHSLYAVLKQRFGKGTGDDRR